MKRVGLMPEYTLIGGILRFETMGRSISESWDPRSTSRNRRWSSSCRRWAAPSSGGAAWTRSGQEDRGRVEAPA